MKSRRDGPAGWMCSLAAVLAILAIQCNAQPVAETAYHGMAEASAAVMLDDRHFVVAEDECNTLLIYTRGQSKPSGAGLDVAEFLKTGDKASDVEGGARLGDIVYWITSHSLPKSGKPREWRKLFFATRVVQSGSAPTLVPHEQPYTGLLEAMIAAPELKDLKLSDAAKTPPERPGGLNIEGLAAWTGDSLLIGFRSPLVSGKAPLVPLTNPAAVTHGSQARFGSPILVDLNGRGVRSIDKVGNEYMIVGGPVADTGTFALFSWSGDPAEPPKMAFELPAGYFPEALLPVPGFKEVDLLSDDGSKQPEAACGSAAKAQQQFRALRVRIP
ncbi:DUF3616 domain-containing protein [Achromobacter deleyi]|uniref:DUF3616 domain-containing protein n=1 Tax=Achromobacter deleyi TaxID=1353891 RepID=UPI001490C68E|nr:DUF3616 domain-containing protein [Achromobacter deleyi]QVQ26979.1 DUF3616 domain-containing protein [Achromobacter deleyi]UIP22557.1 DUF3616 domain-containing protein [Achromobacter deleyi]